MDSGSIIEHEDLPKIKNYKVLKLIQKSRFGLYLVSSLFDKELYVMKFFSFVDKDISPSYMNESRYKDINHPNVIKLLKSNDKELIHFSQRRENVSYIVMEYAPFGTLRSLITKLPPQDDEKLARSFFHQILEGLEHLHSLGIAHMDLKLENILIGKDYLLKVADFDTAAFEDDVFILGRGTSCFRAPELKNKKCKKIKLADIYSLGIMAFTLKFGLLPYAEDILINKFNLMVFMVENHEDFWKAHFALSKGKIQKEEEFAEIFHGMTNIKPEKRWTIQQIKSSNWYNGPIYEKDSLENILKGVVREEKI